MRYNAFISYRHSELDMFVAKQVHRRLETFDVPAKVRKMTGRKKIERVFRDQEELPIGSDLGDNIRTALENSEFLLVICSPRTPQSYWVQTEIRTFIEMHGRENVLAILIEGEPNESFPPELLTDENGNPVEPLAADVRGSDPAEVKKKLKTEIMRLAAPLLHCSYDDLRQRHRERKIRRIIAAMSTGMVLLAGIAGFSIYTARTVQKAAEEIRRANIEIQKASDQVKAAAEEVERNFRGKQISQSRYLADTALQLLGSGDRMTAIAVALEALPANGSRVQTTEEGIPTDQDRPYVAKAEYALNRTLYAYFNGDDLNPDRQVTLDLPVDDFTFNQAGDKIIAYDQGDTVYVFETGEGRLLFRRESPVNEDYTLKSLVNAILTVDDHVLLVYSDQAECFDLEGNLLWSADYAETVDDAAYSAQSDTLALTTDRYVDFYRGNGTKVSRFESPEEENRTMYGVTAFSEDGSLFAAGYYKSRFSFFDGEEDTEENNRVALINVATGEGRSLTVSPGYISKVLFLENDRLAAAVFEEDENMILTGNGTMDCVDLESGSLLWQTDYYFVVNSFTSSSLDMFYRSYPDGSGGAVSNIIVTCGPGLRTISAETGEITYSYETGSAITGRAHVVDSGLVIVTERSGMISFLDADQGITYPDNAEDTGMIVTKSVVRKGCMVIKSYQSPNLVFLKYMEGDGKEVLKEDSAYVDEGKISDDGSMLACECSDDGRLEIFDAQTRQLIYTFYPEDRYISYWNFTPEGCLLVQDDAGLTRVDPRDGTKVVLKEELQGLTQIRYYRDLQKLVYFGTRGMGLVDVEKMELLWSDPSDFHPIRMAALGGAEQEVLCSIDKDNLIHIWNLKEDTVEVVDLPELKTLTSLMQENGMDISPDGNLIAVFGIDGNARIYDIAQGKVTHTIPYVARTRVFLAFTPDGKHLLMQGDDYFFRVYDLEADAFSYLSDEQFYTISGVKYDEENHLVLVYAGSNLYLLQEGSFACICEIPGGMDAHLETGRVLAHVYRTVYLFPYRDLAEQMELAKQTLGDYTLTEEMRTQLNID